MSKKNITKGYLRMMGKTWKSNSKDQSHIEIQYDLCYVEYADELNGKKPGKSEALEKSISNISSKIGKLIKLKFSGKIRCVNCGKLTKKSFNQGSCYNCFVELAQNDLCIMSPTLCHYHLGTCREPKWAEANCFKKHSIYLANTSGAKVGITKEKKIENRWIDQGAVEAIELVTTDSRREAGVIEAYLSQFLPDRTAWQKMVTTNPVQGEIDFVKERSKFVRAIENAKLTMESEKGKSIPIEMKPSKMKESTKINFPIESFSKAKSIKVEPDQTIEGKLLGIKGQYLILQDGVINLRTYEGYEFELIIQD
ncbi:MAG: DUF2797 domain-containing protein [Leptospira sp.]|nr:DUF2797 domain-containing protein [Leptospira sp.]NCS92338.1 DUF2797 domain-containing protein [Leptospira sp.]